MVDTVEKLRIWPAADGMDALSSDYIEAIMRDAADEIERLRHDIERHVQITTEQQAEIERLRLALISPLTSAEQRLIDKHCDWVAFGHAWNAVMKGRRASAEQMLIDKRVPSEVSK